jgi:hypothetical protein
MKPGLTTRAQFFDDHFAALDEDRKRYRNGRAVGDCIYCRIGTTGQCAYCYEWVCPSHHRYHLDHVHADDKARFWADDLEREAMIRAKRGK